MKYCSYCLNHGCRFYEWNNHKDNCSLRHCVCTKCRLVSAQENPQEVTSNAGTSSHVIETSEEGTSNETVSTDVISAEVESELISDPMEEVRRLAQDLYSSDVSEEDLQTVILYSLLESNNFSIEETLKELSDARTAITESLILPALNLNRELNLKRSLTSRTESESFGKPSTSSSSQNGTHVKSPKVCSVSKAKKSFHKNKIEGKECLTKSSNAFVQTESKESKKTTNSQKTTEGSPSESLVMKCTETQTIPCVEKNCIPEGTVRQISVKKPIQSVRPLSNSSSEPTNSRLVNKSNIISSETVVEMSPNTSSSDKSLNFSISSNNFYSSKLMGKKSAKKSTKSQPKVSNSVKDSNKKRLKLLESTGSVGSVGSDTNSTQVVTNSVLTNSVDQSFIEINPNFSPILKTYSKLTLTKKTESNEWSVEPTPLKQSRLCAKIITTEDALAALSAIPCTKPSLETHANPTNDDILEESSGVPQLESNELKDEGERALQSTETKPNTDSKSFSNQFLLFLKQTKPSPESVSDSKTEGQKKSPKTKNIIEITID